VEGVTEIAVIDDHPLVELGLRGVLHGEPALRIVGFSPTVDAFLATGPPAGIVLLDLRLGDGSSPVNNVRRLREHGAEIIVFTSGDDPHLVRLAGQTPILGVLKKSSPSETIVQTLHDAAAGRMLFSNEFASALASDPEIDGARLSGQEARVLALFASGLKSQAVAAELGLASSTVDDYVRRIRAKYARVGRDAHTKVDLYKRAVEDGFLPSPRA
jgi:DNA-binding NarL/FixJ family response regulator